MKSKVTVLCAAAFLSFSGLASAQEDLLDYVVKSCEQDLTQFCSTVNPGEGRLLHCVAAHEDQLSGQCAYDLYQAASLLEQLAVAISYFAESCATDIQANCSDVAPGEGRLLACLENAESVWDACAQAIRDTTG